MEVRWSAVLLGLLVDFLLTILIQGSTTWLDLTTFLSSPDLSPDLNRPPDLILFVLFLLATGVGGYVAGRLAHRSHTLNGFMVGIVGIIVGTFLSFGAPPPAPLVIVGQMVGCGLAALGGFLSTFSVVRSA